MISLVHKVYYAMYICQIRLYWYMKLFIPCLYDTYDFIGAWNYLYHAYLLHTTLLVHASIYTMFICYIRLYWYMQLIIPCSSVTYDFLGTWSVKYDFIGTWSVTYDFIGTLSLSLFLYSWLIFMSCVCYSWKLLIS